MGLFIHIRTDKPDFLYVEGAGGPGSLGPVDVRVRTGSRLDAPGANPTRGFFRPGGTHSCGGNDFRQGMLAKAVLPLQNHGMGKAALGKHG